MPNGETEPANKSDDLSFEELRTETQLFAQIRRAGRAGHGIAKSKLKPTVNLESIPPTIFKLPPPPPSSDADLLRAAASISKSVKEPFTPTKTELSRSLVPTPQSRNNCLNTTLELSAASSPRSDPRHIEAKAMQREMELAAENERLKEEMAAASVKEQQTQVQFQALQERCLELERRVEPQCSEASPKGSCVGSQASGSEIETNSESCTVLRKQLAAYAAEASGMRHRNTQVIFEMRKVCEALRETVHERDELALNAADVEIELRALRVRCAELDATCSSGIEEQRCWESKHQHVENQLETVTTTLENSNVQSKKALLEVEAHASELENRCKQKDARVQSLQDFSTSLLSELHSLQAYSVAQTTEYQSFLGRVLDLHFKTNWEFQETHRQFVNTKHCANSLVDSFFADIQEQQTKGTQITNARNRNYQGKVDKLVRQVSGLVSQIKKLQSEKRDARRELERVRYPEKERLHKMYSRLKKSQELVLLEAALQKNIAKEMCRCRRGLLVERFQRVHKKDFREECILSVPDDKTLMGHKAANYRFYFELELEDVIRIDYGAMSRICCKCQVAAPWHCFSLYTYQNDCYDFICPDDDTIRCLILVLSRLCNRWTSGSIKTRSQFEARKGWCKVEDVCLKEGKTLQRVLVETLRYERKGARAPRILEDLTKSSVERIIATQPPLPPPLPELRDSVDPWRDKLSAEARLQLGIPDPKPKGLFQRWFRKSGWDPEVRE